MTPGGMVVIVPSELEAGFRLAGVESIGVESGEDAAASLREIIAGQDRALIAIYEPFLSALPARERRAAESSLAPVVVPIPAGLERQEKERHQARISEMLSHAVGYHITFGRGGER